MEEKAILMLHGSGLREFSRLAPDIHFLRNGLGTSLVVQWVRLHAPNAGGPGSIPGRGTRSLMHATTKDPACCN